MPSCVITLSVNNIIRTNYDAEWSLITEVMTHFEELAMTLQCIKNKVFVFPHFHKQGLCFSTFPDGGPVGRFLGLVLLEPEGRHSTRVNQSLKSTIHFNLYIALYVICCFGHTCMGLKNRTVIDILNI